MASTTTAQNIMDDVETILSDTGNERWSETELLAWVNAGMKEVSMVKSDAYIQSEAFILAEGTVQSLPTGGFQLLQITHNMGTDGETPGSVIRLTDRHILDVMNSSWHSQDGSATVVYYMYDERMPTQFLVSPPQPSSNFGYVWGTYCKTPTEIATDGKILVGDIYRNVLLDYVLYRAYLKDADYTENANRAIAHYQAFSNSLGMRGNLEFKEDPNKLKRPYRKAVGEAGGANPQ